MMSYPKHKISVAPMMDWTDRHCRYFLRLISQHVLLYTEMITSKAILHGKREQLLAYAPCEHPVALQIGGSDPQELARCAKIVEDFGYDEINLNVGCPSDRVQAGAFGLCLMKSPDLVAESVAAMKSVVKIPVTVKTRIGVDTQDDYASLVAFIEKLIAVDIDQVTLHARKGWLKGLSPKENRILPELKYATVYQIKKDFPHLPLAINGGIETLAAAQEHLQFVDGVMLGRAAYHDAYILAEVDQKFYGARTLIKTRQEVALAYLDYIKTQTQFEPKNLLRHAIGLYHGTPGARRWRQLLSASPFVLTEVLDFLAV
jgi:tRNA-dihydrouridine synthase A